MAEAILAIMPSSGTCEGADLPEDCRTAEQAAPFVEKACADAGLNPAETAAVLALMGLESVDFKFKHNVFPGRPGQGTASMMMPNVSVSCPPFPPSPSLFFSLYCFCLLFPPSDVEKPHTHTQFIAEYATSLFGADKVQGKSPAEVLEMVTPDEHNFGSAVWFLTTKCADARGSLKTGSDEGWLAYMQCVGVPGSDPARMEYWTRAKKAFNL